MTSHEISAQRQAIARVRHEPDLVAVRRLEALLNWQAEKPWVDDWGVPWP